MLSFAAIAKAVGIRGGIIAALLLALAFMWWRADVISGQRDHAWQRAANEAAAHSVTKASLAQLEMRLAAFIDEGDRRKADAARALREQQERSEALGEQIARIRAERPVSGQLERCESAPSVLAAEGL